MGTDQRSRVKTFMIGRKRLVVFASIEQLTRSGEAQG